MEKNLLQMPQATLQSEPAEEKISDNVVVVFKLSEERAKIKKQQAKERREFLRDRLSGKQTG